MVGGDWRGSRVEALRPGNDACARPGAMCTVGDCGRAGLPWASTLRAGATPGARGERGGRRRSLSPQGPSYGQRQAGAEGHARAPGAVSVAMRACGNGLHAGCAGAPPPSTSLAPEFFRDWTTGADCASPRPLRARPWPPSPFLATMGHESFGKYHTLESRGKTAAKRKRKGRRLRPARPAEHRVSVWSDSINARAWRLDGTGLLHLSMVS